jgi:hypothetical protein
LGGDRADFEAELEWCLAGPVEPAVEASKTSALETAAAVEAVRADPEEPMIGVA